MPVFQAKECPFYSLLFIPLRFSTSTGLFEGEDAKELGILGVNLSEQFVATYHLPMLPICFGCCLEPFSRNVADSLSSEAQNDMLVGC